MIGDIICTTLYHSCWGYELGDAEEHLSGDVLQSCLALRHDSFSTYRVRERRKKEREVGKAGEHGEGDDEGDKREVEGGEGREAGGRKGGREERGSILDII